MLRAMESKLPLLTVIDQHSISQLVEIMKMDCGDKWLSKQLRVPSWHVGIHPKFFKMDVFTFNEPEEASFGKYKPQIKIMTCLHLM